MTLYSLSSHPIWKLLYRWGLPTELISIVFSFKTFYSPLNKTFLEYQNNIVNFKHIKEKTPNIFIDLTKLVVNLFFKHNNNESKKIVLCFLNDKKKIYKKSPEYVLKTFIDYHADKYNEARGAYSKNLIKCKYDSFVENTPLDIITLLQNNLISLLRIKFSCSIYRIINRKYVNLKLGYYSYYVNKFDIKYIFKKYCFCAFKHRKKKLFRFIPEWSSLFFEYT